MLTVCSWPTPLSSPAALPTTGTLRPPSDTQRQISSDQEIKEGDGERRQAVISLQAKRGLERLETRHGIRQAAMLKRLILDEQRRTTDAMDTDPHRAYVGESVTA